MSTCMAHYFQLWWSLLYTNSKAAAARTYHSMINDLLIAYRSTANYSTAALEKRLNALFHLCLQYGFFNSALEKLIRRRFGDEKWEEIW